jgi:peptide/nickel transport system substrate-binding protein
MIFRNNPLRAAAIGLFVATLALAGCANSSSPSSTSSSGGSTGTKGAVLAVYDGASGQFVENYNPFSPTVLSDVQGMIYEPLFFFNTLAPLGTPAVPLLGKSYTWNAKGTVLAVTLKSGVKWSDGQPFTSKDVVFTFDVLQKTPSLDTTGDVPVAKATDATHLTLTFTHPSFVDGPTYLGTTYIVPEHIWKGKTNFATDVNKNPVGTGPMTMASFTPESYLLTKNTYFRGAATMQVSGVRVYSLSGNQAGTNMLLAGQLDWAGIFIPSVDQVLKAAPQVSYSATSNQETVLNTCSNAALGCTGPQTDPIVRQAIYDAIDRAQIGKLAYYGRGTAISPTFVLPAKDQQKFIAKQFSSSSPMSSNVPAAESLLKADGWVKGSDGIFAKDGKPLSLVALVTSGYTDAVTISDVMSQQLKAAGIDMQVKQVANAENLSAQGLGTYQVAIGGIYEGPVDDPFYMYNNQFDSSNAGRVGVSSNPYGNVARFSSPVVDAAIAQAGATQNVTVKAAAYAKIQAVIVKSLPYIPVISTVSFAEFSTANYTGFPTFNNQYASADPGGAPGNGVVLTKLKMK